MSVINWWERSPYSSGNQNFCRVASSGITAILYADESIGVAFAFCI